VAAVGGHRVPLAGEAAGRRHPGVEGGGRGFRSQHAHQGRLAELVAGAAHADQLLETDAVVHAGVVCSRPGWKIQSKNMLLLFLESPLALYLKYLYFLLYPSIRTILISPVSGTGLFRSLESGREEKKLGSDFGRQDQVIGYFRVAGLTLKHN